MYYRKKRLLRLPGGLGGGTQKPRSTYPEWQKRKQAKIS